MNDEIIFGRQGPVATVCLNRPAALNAQNHTMVAAFARQLAAWEADPAVGTLFIYGAGERAFCAGGDIRVLWAQERAEQLAFFDVEYELCYRLAHTRLTTVAYMDGITMGGGVGLSVFADRRLATPRTVWAMPEVKIGFFPDIAGGYFLPRLPAGAGLGRYLGLMGARLDGAGCLAAGIATHYVGAGQEQALIAALAEGGDMAAWQIAPPETNVPALAAALQPCATAPLPDFIAQLKAQNLWADDACHYSIAITDALMTVGARLGHRQTVDLDGRLARHFLAGRTFPAGVHARLIDKGSTPDWPPAWPDAAEISQAFAGFATNTA